MTVLNSKTGETLSYYDAHVFDTKTHKNRIKEGFDTVIFKNGNEKPYNEITKTEITQEIREVKGRSEGKGEGKRKGDKDTKERQMQKRITER